MPTFVFHLVHGEDPSEVWVVKLLSRVTLAVLNFEETYGLHGIFAIFVVYRYLLCSDIFRYLGALRLVSPVNSGATSSMFRFLS